MQPETLVPRMVPEEQFQRTLGLKLRSTAGRKFDMPAAPSPAPPPPAIVSEARPPVAGPPAPASPGVTKTSAVTKILDSFARFFRLKK